MMRYTILIFILLHYSWGCGIYEEMRKQLDELQKKNESFTFNISGYIVPARPMISKPCACGRVFVETLKKVLENVKPKDDNMKNDTIVNLMKNLDSMHQSTGGHCKQDHTKPLIFCLQITEDSSSRGIKNAKSLECC
uniref:Uncharacterized protein n=1 Tax=Anguilla anguilla TaxID=7936 RepID=A0A0E9XAH5_ANGAN